MNNPTSVNPKNDCWSYSHERDHVDLNALKENLKFVNVTSQMVQEAFENAKMKNTHPRLIISLKDLEEIKKRISDKEPYTLACFRKLKSSADRLLAIAPPEWTLDEGKLRVKTMHSEHSYGLPTLGIIYHLTGEEKYAEQAWRFLEAYTLFQDWGINRHALDTGAGCANISMGYDLIYDYLNDEQRFIIEKVILEKALIPGLKGLRHPEWWSTISNNWNGICHCGLSFGALTLYERDPEMMNEIISTALNRVTKYLSDFEPAGQSEEGLMYWGYGLMFGTIYLEACKRVLGTDFGRSDTAGMRNAGHYPINISGPVVGLSIGDDPVKKSRSGTQMWFAYRYKDRAIAKYAYNPEGTSEWRDLLFYDHELFRQDDSEFAEPSLDNYTPGIELVSLRSTWNHDVANYIAIHGGYNSASHGHLDAGQIDIQANGRYWIMGGLGGDNYNAPGFFSKETFPGYADEKTEQTVPGRWHFYRLRAEGKSCVVINADGKPDIRPDQDEKGTAIIERVESSPAKAFAVVDLTDPYKRDARKYKRGIMLSNYRQIITVQDEITAQTDNAKIWWLANTPSDKITISEDGKSAILQIESDRMWVGLQSPAEGRFKEIPATYLPGEFFPHTINYENTVKKLAVELSNVENTTITINFIPLEAGQEKPAFEIQAVVPLAEWSK